MTENPFKKEDINVNARALVQAIQFLIDTNEWGDVFRYQACIDPVNFINSVERYRDDPDSINIVERYDALDVYMTGYTEGGIVKAVKAYRDVFGCGLADAKTAVESMPCRIGKFKRDEDALPYVIETLTKAEIRLIYKFNNDSIPLSPGADLGVRVPAGWAPSKNLQVEVKKIAITKV